MSKYEDMKGKLQQVKRRQVHEELIQPVEPQKMDEEEKKTQGRPAKLKVKPMTITIDKELFDRFDEAVWKVRGNKSEIIRQLIQGWLTEQK